MKKISLITAGVIIVMLVLLMLPVQIFAGPLIDRLRCSLKQVTQMSEVLQLSMQIVI